MPTLIDGIVTSLLTYAMHSFIACILALGLSRVLRRPQERDLLWKVTLIAPLLTAAFAVVLSFTGTHGGFVDLADLVRRAPNVELPGREVQVRMFYTGSGSRVERQFTDPVTTALSVAAMAIIMCVTVVSLVRLARRRRALARAISDRRTLGTLPLVARGNTVALSAATDLVSPVALGTAEICLPSEVADEFCEQHQRSLIAHEVAHLERGDPAWFFAAELIAALSAFQPMIFVVLRAFRRDVELICDEAAVRRTSDQQSLIGALALLASPFDPRSPLHGAATAYDGSPLVARAERIATLSLAVTASNARRPALMLAAVLVGVLCAVPVVSAAPRLTDFPRNPEAMLRGAPHSRRIVTVDERVVRTKRRVAEVNE
jgi:beta-lactamase regulating signal transducer with metallopeptidase domain